MQDNTPDTSDSMQHFVNEAIDKHHKRHTALFTDKVDNPPSELSLIGQDPTTLSAQELRA